LKKKALIICIIVFFSFLPPLGAQTWSATSRLTWNSGQSFNPKAAIDSDNNIHMLWQDITPGNYEIFYKKSTNGGITWSTKRLSWTSGVSKNPAIAVESGNHIHVVWYDETPGNAEIYYKRSTNGGVTWGSIKRLTWNSGGSYSPEIAADSGQIHVAWEDNTPGNYEIYYKRSANGGETWGSIKRLTWNTGGSYRPAIAIDSSDNIHMVWKDSTPGNFEIYYKRSTDGGVNWGDIRRLTWTMASIRPAITIDSSDNIHTVWYESSPGNDEIYYKRSTNGGVTWDSTKRLTWNAGDSYAPEIAVDSNNGIHLGWYDFTPGNAEIFYKRSTNNGVSWESAKRLTWNTGYSGFPAIALDLSDTIHIFWNDGSPGNDEIYYKNGGQ
jgi:hypothetical protein